MSAPKNNQYAKGNKGGGAPTKYKPEYIHIAARLCEKGPTDREIAEVLGVCERTFHNWKLAHEEFSAALERAKEVANEKVEQPLIMRALGFEREVEKVSGGRIFRFTEYFPPELSAIRLWLRNRMPEVYRS
jgi:uncharacterized protein YjcR